METFELPQFRIEGGLSLVGEGVRVTISRNIEVPESLEHVKSLMNDIIVTALRRLIKESSSELLSAGISLSATCVYNGETRQSDTYTGTIGGAIRTETIIAKWICEWMIENIK